MINSFFDNKIAVVTGGTGSFGKTILRRLLKTNIKDTTSGFRVFSRNALKVIDFQKVNTNGYGFQIEMAYLSFINDLSIKEIPIIFEERRMGESKMSSKIIFEALFLLIKIFLNKSFYKKKFFNN